MRLEKNNDTNEVLEDNVAEVTQSTPESKVTMSDAKILLNSGRMGLIFIGVVVGFFVLSLLLTFFHFPTWFYVVIGVVSAPLLLFYYLKIHENDEDKLD